MAFYLCQVSEHAHSTSIAMDHSHFASPEPPRPARRPLAFILPAIGAVPIAIGLMMSGDDTSEPAPQTAENLPPAELTPTSGQQESEPVEFRAVRAEESVFQETAPEMEAMAITEGPVEQAPPVNPLTSAPEPEKVAETEAGVATEPEAEELTEEEIAAAEDAQAEKDAKRSGATGEMADLSDELMEEIPPGPVLISEFHTVEPGQSLYGIGQTYGMTSESLARANGITTQTPIRPGQQLTIPRQGQPAPPSQLRPVSGSNGPPATTSVRPQNPPRNTTPVVVNDAELGYGPAGRPAPGTANPAPPVYQTVSNGPVSSPPQNITPVSGANGPAPPIQPISQPAPVSSPSLANAYCLAYVVQPQDTVQSIANALSTSPQAIVQANGRQSIRSGETILVPIGSIVSPCQ